MEIEPIKTLTLFENILCVYRNISVFGRVIKFCGYVRIFFECIFIIYNTSLHVAYLKSFAHQTEGLFFFSSILNSICVVLLSCWYSKEFVLLSKYLHQNHSFFASDKNYNREMDITQRNAIIVAATFFFIHVLSFILLRYARHFDITGVSPVLKYFFHAHLALCDHRFIFEYIALCTLLKVMSEQLCCTVRSIDDIEKEMRDDLCTGQQNQHENKRHLEAFDKLCTIYTNIKEVSKLFNTIYGLQITVMLASIVFYFIICLYSVTSQSVKGELSLLGSVFYIFSTCLLLCILALLSRSAQRTQNFAAALRRRLGRLLIHSLDWPNDDYYKSTRDLIRLVATRPIRTQAFGSISVDMTLIPTCVLFFTYYVVIALQFNNVV